MTKRITNTLNKDDLIPAGHWQDANGREVSIPAANGWTHLQFRRYSGCAVCNLHLHSFIARQNEIRDADIQEMIIFNSTRERILNDMPDCPFTLIADPHRSLYAEFGVDQSVMAVLNPAVWLPALRGAMQFGVQVPRDDETSLGLPADFLIRSDGKIVAAHYGKHANDQWSVDELLTLVRTENEVA
ncbi:peroxiredoxin-like family protein [Cellvibrio sp. UBA7661]|uniref:peroxiredoxin-like family protein n=1 Tax=Cellvibrio sp. UBA7661 TaxID=1946311 RepID=UPI002F35BBC8